MQDDAPPLNSTSSNAALAVGQDRPLFKAGTAPARTKSTQPDERASLASGASRSLASELVPTGLALGATLLVIVLARTAIKRFGPASAGGARPQGVVEVLARYPVARGQQVVLLKVGRRVIVAHQGAQGMQSLSEFSGEAEVADLIARCEAGARVKSPFSFDALLRQSSRSLDRGEREAEPRAALPDIMRNAEIETVDLTRNRGRKGSK
jgi:flagellar biogenesis protein FliO